MKQTIFVIIIAVIISGCATTKKKNTTQNNSFDTSPKATVYLLTPTFANNLNTEKVTRECSMLKQLEASILENASSYGVNIVRAGERELTADDIVLDVEYISLISHKWKMFAIKPSSEAMLEVVFKKDGRVLDQINKNIGSSVAFGACDRLEKIAESGGNFVAKWGSRMGY